MQFFTDSHFRFMRYRKVGAVVSIALTVLGIVLVFVQRRLNVGIDFAGGTQLIVQFAEEPDIDQLRRELAAAGMDDVQIQQFGEADSHELMIRTPVREGAEEGRGREIMEVIGGLHDTSPQQGFDLNRRGTVDLAALLMERDPDQLRAADEIAAQEHYEEVAEAVLHQRRELGLFRDWNDLAAIELLSPEAVQVLRDGGQLGSVALLGEEVVGPTVGAELRQKGIWAVALSLLAMLAYIWVRFELRFGIGAVVATFHDVAIVLGLFALLGYEFNLTTVAAFLTLVGYSVNDSVVVFDRVRENMLLNRRKPFEEIIDISLNQTLSRTILTSVTTLLAVGSLLVFGGDVLRGFAFVLTLGIVVGTYSSIWVAGAFALLWEERGWGRRSGGDKAARPAAKERELRAAGGGRRG